MNKEEFKAALYRLYDQYPNLVSSLAKQHTIEMAVSDPLINRNDHNRRTFIERAEFHIKELLRKNRENTL